MTNGVKKLGFRNGTNLHALLSRAHNTNYWISNLYHTQIYT